MGRIYCDYELRDLKKADADGLNIISQELVRQLIDTALVEMGLHNAAAKACVMAIHERDAARKQRDEFQVAHDQLRENMTSLDITCATLRRELRELQGNTVHIRDYDAMRKQRDELEVAHAKAVGEGAKRIGAIALDKQKLTRELEVVREELRTSNEDLETRRKLCRDKDAVIELLRQQVNDLVKQIPERGSIAHQLQDHARRLEALEARADLESR